MSAAIADYEASREVEAQKTAIVAESDGEKISPILEKAPDGGTRAWLVTAGAFFIWFSALGYANSFGVFQEYYMKHQLQYRSADDIAWIGSLTACLQFVIGAIAGPVFDRYGAWVRSLAAFSELRIVPFADMVSGYPASCDHPRLFHDDAEPMP